MKKSKLGGLIKEGRSTREIAKEVDLGQTTVRYWLKKYGLKTNVDLSSKCLQATGKTRNGLSYYCFKCGEKNVEKFYGKKRNICNRFWRKVIRLILLIDCVLHIYTCLNFSVCA